MKSLPVPEASPKQAERASKRGREHWVVLGLAALALVGLGVLRLLLEPDPRGFGTHEKLGLQPCMPLELWNIPCPGCGVTTAVTHAAHGDLTGALRTQPFGLLLVFGVLLFAPWALWVHLSGRDLWRALHAWRWSRLGWIVGTAMGLAWIYKLAVVRGWLL